MFRCEFCDNLFTTKNGLSNHKRKARYCLTGRGKQIDKFICEGCSKEFTEKRYLENHEEKCNTLSSVLSVKNKLKLTETSLLQIEQQNKDYEKTIKNLQTQVEQLQNKLENIAVQGVKKVTNTTNILKLEPLAKEWLESQALLLTERHFSQGIAGLAQFAVENSFKDRVVCTDMTRKSLKYKDNNGEIKKDPKGKKLATLFFNSIHSKAENIIPDMIEKIKDELHDAGDEEILESIRVKMNDLISVEKGIKQISKGHETELREQFTCQLCELLPNP